MIVLFLSVEKEGQNTQCISTFRVVAYTSILRATGNKLATG